MKQKHKNIHLSHLSAVAASGTLALLVTSGITTGAHRGGWHGPATGHTGFLAAAVLKGEQTTDTPLMRQAKRLRKRLRKTSFLTPPLTELASALQERKILLGRYTKADLRSPDGNTFPAWEISLHRYPTWIKGTFTSARAEFSVNEKRIADYLTQNGIEGLKGPIVSRISLIETDDRGVLRVQADQPAKPGYVFDAPKIATSLKEVLDEGASVVTLTLDLSAGSIINETGQDLGKLTLIAEGRSNFAGSVPGRIANVRKGLRERTHNILVPPGETFSFNKTLGPVTSSAGWYEALGIFNGDELRPVTGGGICQVATTTYRAILLAGLPVVNRKAHSLYVSYYEKYGVGMDATVYPGQQDLTFTNDTGNFLLVQSYDDGFEARVNIYGTSDGRIVRMEGPYFATNAPEDLSVHDRSLAKNEIVWRQHITYGGVTVTNTIVSRYKTIPLSIARKYSEEHIAEGNAAVTHTAAPAQGT
ncbi:MAG: VanW family protein [Patescibacteria group bacterium]